ncbi:class I SAM-dependent methyltransferase [Methylobacterium durans]|uniref:class I SAM-dependent methyltransferase n=1 Tax=Methylobacterium durans TaxID=2202825 RepID=UPI002AFFCF31|nr:class I SAM-dependent methyltransferase [Methylobacterium durans]MEA1835050.1 class I SAM-dependent methyltransferase [Methylobacterium durans]
MTKHRCKICSSSTELFDVVDLGKTCWTQPYILGLDGRPVYYRSCQSCGFIFTTFFDEWTSEQWSSEIYNSDYVKVDPEFTGSRPLRLAKWISEKFRSGKDALNFLDYGSGMGELGAELKRHGFTVDNYDPFFSDSYPSKLYDIVTAFEVVEHSPDPKATFREMASFVDKGGLILFSTSLSSKATQTERGRWWYIAPRNGHVSIYSSLSLQSLAEENGFRYFSDGLYHAFFRVPNTPLQLQAQINLAGWTPANEGVEKFSAYALGQWNERELHGVHPFRWTGAKSCTIMIVQQPAFMGRLKVRLPFVGTLVAPEEISLNVLSGGTLISQVVTSAAAEIILQTNGSTEIAFEISTSKICCPAECVEGSPDARMLGVAIATPTIAAFDV